MFGSFAELVRDARKRLEMSQDSLAQAILKPKSWVVDIERGRTVPTNLSVLLGLARALNIDVGQVVAQVLHDRNLYRKLPSEVWESAGEAALVQFQGDEILRAKATSYSALEADAEALAASRFEVAVGQGASIPVPQALREVKEIAADRRLETEVRLEVDDGLTEEGVTGIEGKELVVRVRADVWDRAVAGEGRHRFTVAHELAHALLHHEELRQAEGCAFRDAVCTATEKLASGIRIYESPEWQANSWASSFLMPSEAVRRYLERIQDAREEFRLDAFAANFQVSPQAARVRLDRLLPRLAARRAS
jgi:transcriptional regulator with XRE-family HTH domain